LDAAGLRRQIGTAVEVPRWSWAFYRRHFLLVAGISLLPAAQRIAWVLWNERLPGALNVGLEALTLAVRLLLVVLIARIAFAGSGRGGVWRFLRERWLSLVFQVLFLGGLAAVFDFVPERIVAARVPPDLQRAYWAALLGLKNPTVIAFTMVWMVGAARQASLYPQPLRYPAAPPAA
jgi:hypothetical protein